MISLIELAKEGKLEKTGAKPKLPIKVDGVSSETLDVYKIPLEYLYYNDKKVGLPLAFLNMKANCSQQTKRTTLNIIISLPS